MDTTLEDARFAEALQATLARTLKVMEACPFYRWNPVAREHEFGCWENPTPYDINNGGCEEFCSDVCNLLGGESDVLYGAGAENMRDFEDYFEDWSEVSHTFIVYKGRYYDAECLSGVDHWFDLPLCKKAFDARTKRSRERKNSSKIE